MAARVKRSVLDENFCFLRQGLHVFGVRFAGGELAGPSFVLPGIDGVETDVNRNTLRHTLYSQFGFVVVRNVPASRAPRLQCQPVKRDYFVNTLGQPALSPAETAVGEGFCDQEKDEKRFGTRLMHSARGDALRRAAATRLEVTLAHSRAPLRLCDHTLLGEVLPVSSRVQEFYS